MKIEITKFVERQWDAKFAGTKMFGIDKEKFIDLVNIEYTQYNQGFANCFSDNCCYVQHSSFCSYFYINNKFQHNYLCPTIKTAVIPIDHTIYPYIQSGYSSRTSDELPVLSRWVHFPHKSYELPIANTIGLVLYTREQLLKEHNEMFPPADYQVTNTPWTDKGIAVMEQPKFELSDDCEFGIVAIMGLNTAEMDPMPPMTHLRNALGTKEGGNGTPINREEYQKSVDFWSKYILVK